MALMVGGFVLGVAVCALVFVVAIKAKRRREGEKSRVEKETVFTLPDRENTFLKDRLRTRLNPAPENTMVEMKDVKIAPVRVLIGKLKALPLSPAERLGVSAFSRKVTEYALKERLESEEASALNDGFSSLLKLAAKYGVY